MTRILRGSAATKSISPAEAERFKYRWIVLVCSFMVRVFIFGTVMSVGVLYVEWLKDFGTGKGETALIGSIATGSALFMGPVSSVLLERFSCRQVIMMSGISMSLGLVCSSFSNGIPYLCVSFGIVAGCAGGVANLAAIVSLCQYFDRQRPLAVGIGSGGVGCGIFLFGLMQNYFIEMYTWRGSLLLMGGILLHLTICGLFMMHPAQLFDYKALWNWRNRSSELDNSSRYDETSARPIVKSNSDRKVCIECNDVESLALPEIQVDPGDERICADERENNHNNHINPSRRRKSTFQLIKSKIRLTEKTVQLWKDPMFVILFVSDFLSWLVQFVPYVHLPERAAMLGIENGAVLISLMGICSAVGKIVFGAICSFCDISAFKVFLVAQTLFGLCTVLSPFCLNFASLCVFAVCFGFLSGSYSLMMVIPAKVLGEENFSLAYGFMLAGEGLGVYLGPPLVGWISDATASYNTSFFVAGFALLASALVLLGRPLLLACRKRNGRISQPKAW
ncbi:unnamed protein product [Clavelina lepadiformis]|uniref:Major facilitator superfamily (MFS) profile domain-containing protein n=1 Tax=Clavelina lepadiformis TaxID=159417 RepID=A0ABP0F2B6_CLALP